jgi:hypothetical protein
LREIYSQGILDRAGRILKKVTQKSVVYGETILFYTSVVLSATVLWKSFACNGIPVKLRSKLPAY